MLFRHPEHPGRGVRLAYCLNLHPSETLAQIEAALREVTLPLRDRLAPGRLFGVGMYLPAQVARELRGSQQELGRLKGMLDHEGLDAFTFNAFPYGGFHGERLKERVFEPTWADPRRLEFTQDVLGVANALDAPGARASHVSISTHSGAHSSSSIPMQPFLEAFLSAGVAFARSEESGGPRAVLAVEPEPRSTCNDTKLLALLHKMLRHIATRTGKREQAATVARHVGTCLDTCHVAVEFERPDNVIPHDAPWLGDAWLEANLPPTPLGKLQFTSALALQEPRVRNAARARLLALDEPRYLHQVTGRRRHREKGQASLLQVGDLSELAAALEERDSPWLECDEWRCHFHVPVDLQSFGGLSTTRDVADAILAQALVRPQDWGTTELHVEIETYTWSLLPPRDAGPGALVDGLEREYRHVLQELERAGWMPA